MSSSRLLSGTRPSMKRSVELDEEAVLGGVHHHGIEVFADAVLHEFHLLPLHELALGFGGAAFVVAALFRDRAEIVFTERRYVGSALGAIVFDKTPTLASLGWGTRIG